MSSKAERLRSKRIKQGRPRKEGVPRHPCGQINKKFAREETERAAKEVVMTGRINVHQLHGRTEKDIAEFGGYTAGRLFLDGKISKQQLEAGNEYAAVAYRYCTAVGIPMPTARAQELGRVRGYSGEETETAQRRATRATNDMMRLVGVLASCAEGPQVKSTVHNLFVMDDEALRLMPERQMEWLRRGLNSLILHDGLRKYGKSGITVSA